MTTHASHDSEDIPGALAALERRAAHLSDLIHPPVGETTHRTAHWRDKEELKGLRVGVKAIREYAERRTGRSAVPPTQQLDDATLKLLANIADTIDDVLEKHDVRPDVARRLRELTEQIDGIVDDAE